MEIWVFSKVISREKDTGQPQRIRTCTTQKKNFFMLNGVGLDRPTSTVVSVASDTRVLWGYSGKDSTMIIYERK